MARRGLSILAFLCAAAVAGSALAFAASPGTLPASVTSYLLGPKLIRGEIVIKGKDRSLRDMRLDRGKLIKRYSSGSLTLLERDTTKVVIKVVPSARVFLNARPSGFRFLRLGMQVAIAHEVTPAGDLPADTVYATGPRQQPKWAPPAVAQLFGNKFVKAELFVMDTAQHDYRLDRGKVRQVGAFQLVLREADGTDVPVDISPSAHIKLNNQNGTFLQLRKGMMATTMRDGDKPADQVYATGK